MKSKAYLMGFDCAMNGANTTNCHFSIFSSEQNTREWEQGKQDGELEKLSDKKKKNKKWKKRNQTSS